MSPVATGTTIAINMNVPPPLPHPRLVPLAGPHDPKLKVKEAISHGPDEGYQSMSMNSARYVSCNLIILPHCSDQQWGSVAVTQHQVRTRRLPVVAPNAKGPKEKGNEHDGRQGQFKTQQAGIPWEFSQFNVKKLGASSRLSFYISNL